MAKAKLKKKSKYGVDAREIAALRNSRPLWSIVMVADGSAWICTACAAKGNQVLMLKHKEDCPYVEIFKAIDVLDAALNGRGK